MFKRKFVIWTIFIFIIGSCRSTMVDPLETPPNDLIKSFKIPEKKLKEYQEYPHQESPKEKIAKIVKKKKINKKLIRNNNKIVNKVNERAKIENNIEKFEKTQNPNYSKDYPEEFIKYDNVSKKFWNLYSRKYFPNEEHIMDVRYFGITCGTVKIQNLPILEINGHEVFHYFGQIKSSPYYKYVYHLSDTIESFVDTKSIIPMKYSLIQRESKQTVDDLQLFNKNELKTYVWYKRKKENNDLEYQKETVIPYHVQDSFSGLFFVRGLPLKLGDYYEFPIITRGKLWLLKVKVHKIDKIRIMQKSISAIHVLAETHFPGVLSKKGDISFWFSNDEFHKLLKFSAKVKIGSIEGVLVDYKIPLL